MIRETWYDVMHDSNHIRYSVFRVVDGALEQFTMTFSKETREEMAHALWNEMRPAIRGLQPFRPDKIYLAAYDDGTMQ